MTSRWDDTDDRHVPIISQQTAHAAPEGGL